MSVPLYPKLAGNPSDWRKAKNLGAKQVSEMMRVFLGETSRHVSSVTKMEKHGSHKSSAVRAYAKAVGVDFNAALEVFESIATEIKKKKSLECKPGYKTFSLMPDIL